ncbi:MAG: hypothetical protein M1816_002567 [Peltula sp. TS41687]|nr:MAG: hypothetical protein M1816_002567 [Peltula sp. TS41687]
MRLMCFHVPLLTLSFALPFALALPMEPGPRHRGPQRSAISGEEPNLASWATAGVGGLTAAILGAHFTGDTQQKPQGELEILLEQARTHRGRESNTASCVYRKSKDFFSGFDHIDLPAEMQMKLTIKWVADCRRTDVPEMAKNAEEEALQALESANQQSSATTADKGDIPEEQENRFQPTSDLSGPSWIGQAMNRALRRVGGALRKAHGGFIPIQAQSYGMRGLMAP